MFKTQLSANPSHPHKWLSFSRNFPFVDPQKETFPVLYQKHSIFSFLFHQSGFVFMKLSFRRLFCNLFQTKTCVLVYMNEACILLTPSIPVLWMDLSEKFKNQLSANPSLSHKWLSFLWNFSFVDSQKKTFVIFMSSIPVLWMDLSEMFKNQHSANPSNLESESWNIDNRSLITVESCRVVGRRNKSFISTNGIYQE
jgi:hypothetical protein